MKTLEIKTQWEELREARAVDTADYGVEEGVAAEFLQSVQNASVLAQLGVRFVPVPTGSSQVPIVVNAPGAAWTAEGGAVPNTDLFFNGGLATRAVKAGVLVSRELGDDSPIVDRIVREELAKAIGNELDRGVLVGDGSGGEPNGITGTGTHYTTAAGADLAAAFARLYKNIGQDVTVGNLTKGVASNGIVMNPQAYGQALIEAAAADQFIFPVFGFPILQTNACPEGSGFIGYWPQIAIGVSMDVTIERTQRRYEGTDQYHYLARIYADVVVGRGEYFGEVTAINNTPET